MHKHPQSKIKEISSPAFEQGFFVATDALQKDTYNCKTCLDAMKEHGYSINSAKGQQFVSGWKYSTQ